MGSLKKSGRKIAGAASLTAFLTMGGGAQVHAQRAPVTAKVELVSQKSGSKQEPGKGAADFSNVIVWLIPMDATAWQTAKRTAKPPQLLQRNKHFEPHVLVVQTGEVIAFPNRDPFFHNVFSLFEGKRFDLGLYEAGTAKTARFERAGPSFLFCNIHPEMSAVVMAVETPYFGLSDRAGRVVLPDVPDGRYRLYVWYERSLPEDLRALEHDVEIAANSRALGTLRVVLNPNWSLVHKNKYGQDYVPAASTGYPDH
jgi:plastocyanin